VLGAALGCALVLVSAGSAQAQTRQQAEEQKAVVAGTTLRFSPARITASGRRCRQRTVERWGKNLIGKKVIRFFQTTRWCYSGGKIRDLHRRAWGETPGLGWKYKGPPQLDRDWGPQKRWFRGWAQGKFELCGGGFCIQEKNFWVEQTVFGRGGHRFRFGG
jgi:hypothetical protein